jgi:group I intron endonuclease
LKKQLSRPGVYAIRNTSNGKHYVGSSTNIYGRWSSHKSLLKNSRHDSIVLQRAWTKHGSTAFEWVVLEFCERDRLIEREEHWIIALKSQSRANGYNVRLQATSNFGHKFPPEFGARISAAKKGRKLTPEARAAMSASMKAAGHKPCEAAHIASREKRRGSKVSEETRRLISERVREAKASRPDTQTRCVVPPETVAGIQRLVGEGSMSQWDIARRFGVSQSYVSRIKNNRFARLNCGANDRPDAAPASRGPAEDPE